MFFARILVITRNGQDYFLIPNRSKRIPLKTKTKSLEMSLFVAIIENINIFLIRPLYLCFHLTFHYKVVINYCGYHFHPFTMTFLGCVHPSIRPVSPPHRSSLTEKIIRARGVEEDRPRLRKFSAASGAAFALPFRFALESRRPLTPLLFFSSSHRGFSL